MKSKALIILLIAALLIPTLSIKAAVTPNNLKGRILIQVESKGEAWYVNPKDGLRYYMADGSEAFQIMKNLGVGMSNKDIEKMKADANFRKKFIGKILLQVESHGEAYYISFNGRYNYLKDGAAAYDVMRKLGLGISNKDLAKISTYSKSAISNPIVKNTGVLDCGIADQSNATEKVFKSDLAGGGTQTSTISEYDKIDAYTCMGKAMLNSCQKATVKVKSVNGTIHTEEILGGDNTNCNLKVTFGEVNAADEEEIMIANTYLQCAYPRSVLKESGCFMLNDDACNFFGIKDSPAHIYANNIANMYLSVVFSADEVKCTGTMVDKIKK